MLIILSPRPRNFDSLPVGTMVHTIPRRCVERGQFLLDIANTVFSFVGAFPLSSPALQGPVRHASILSKPPERRTGGRARRTECRWSHTLVPLWRHTISAEAPSCRSCPPPLGGPTAAKRWDVASRVCCAPRVAREATAHSRTTVGMVSLEEDA